MIALKLHAWRNGSEHRKNKDWDDIASMMEACAVDIRDPGFKMLVERYGGPHAWQKISKSF
ncbi:MAG: hypothetical protein SFY92_01695 [Verrucomicrobiae bacterium]|nr:hypothetical protein [Verrucomicrobiae bacterium]